MRHTLTRRALLRLIGLAGLGTLLTGTLAMRLPEGHSTRDTSKRDSNDERLVVSGWLLNTQDR
ncbi:hypothetical protein [Litchfieldella xinjiangensis]|uniref:hypothetical protein n=1 Tax=Litchfieldella xinjiangensis TaxID=1166948 RepID=UPI0012E052AD|nr:hypothetical protein [Halomonas xinjiangensis]